MKIVVIGGSGLIGSQLVNRLREKDHEVLAASPESGVNTITGEGLVAALQGAQAVVDVANSPSFDDRSLMMFFETSSRNLLAAGEKAGVRHHVALSIVGTERLQDSGYFRAKIVQEKLIRASKIPYTIVHSTQFFEFVSGIVKSAAGEEVLHLSPALVQPIASADVADALTGVTLGPPVNGMVEIAGPERMRLSDMVARYLSAINDLRKVVPDVHALYFGAELNNQALLPGNSARIAGTRFEDWLWRQRVSGGRSVLQRA